MPRKFRDLLAFLYIPNAHAGGVATLPRHQIPAVLRKSQTGDGFSRGIDDVILTVLSRIEEHHGAAGRVGHQPAGGGRGQARIVGYSQAQNSLKFDL